MDESLFITSSLLPVAHAFSTRLGGVSPPPWASLNLGHRVGDAPERVAENFRRLSSALGLSPDAVQTVDQVHGDQVREVAIERPLAADVQADALWSEADGQAVAVRTADCVPLLLVDPHGRRVAAIHAGWRGTALEIAARTVEVLAARGSRPNRLLAALGPHIRRCCYEISAELAAQFAGQFGTQVIEVRGSAYHLDLSLAVRHTLEKAGLSRGSIDSDAPCTACETGRFFSHRREGGRTGRQLAVVACRF